MAIGNPSSSSKLDRANNPETEPRLKRLPGVTAPSCVRLMMVGPRPWSRSNCPGLSGSSEGGPRFSTVAIVASRSKASIRSDSPSKSLSTPTRGCVSPMRSPIRTTASSAALRSESAAVRKRLFVRSLSSRFGIEVSSRSSPSVWDRKIDSASRIRRGGFTLVRSRGRVVISKLSRSSVARSVRIARMFGRPPTN